MLVRRKSGRSGAAQIGFEQPSPPRRSARGARGARLPPSARKEIIAARVDSPFTTMHGRFGVREGRAAA